MKKAVSILSVIAILLSSILLFSSCKKSTTGFDAQKDYELYDNIKTNMQETEKKYYDENGYIPEEAINKALSDLEQIAKEKQNNKELKSYSVEDTGIFIKFNDGVGYLYTLKIKDLMADDKLKSIITVEPYATNKEFVSHYILGGKSPDKAAKNIVKDKSLNYGFQKENNIDYFDIEDIKKIENQKIIIWYGHGGYASEYGSVLGSSIPITDQYTLLAHQQELSDGDLALGNDCFYMCPSYFEKHLSENSLNGSLVYLAACESARDNRLADIFLSKGASLVVGNTKSIRIRYNLYMMYDFISSLANKNNDASYWTAEQALSYAKQQNGEKDSEFWSPGAEVKLIFPENQANYSLNVKEENTSKQESNTEDEEKIFKEYIKNNLKTVDTNKSLFDKEIYDSVFSSLIKDFDNDGKKELITFSIVKTNSMVIRLYAINNGKVEKIDESTEYALIGGGNCDLDMCAVSDNNKIRIYVAGCSFGGSRDLHEYILYSVKNKKLLVESDLSNYFIGPENYLSLTDNLTKNTFSSTSEFDSAAKAVGFDTKKHPHYEVPTDKTSLSSFSDDHIFVYLSSLNFSGNYKVIYDYTSTSNKSTLLSRASSSITTKTSVQNTDFALDLYYRKNFNSKSSGKYTFDFNKDGKNEMLVTDYSLSSKGVLSSCNLYLLSENSGSVKVIGTYKINNSTFANYSVFIDEPSEYNRQYFEVYANKKGYVSCNIFQLIQGCSGHYLIFDLSKNSFNLKQHLLDPGYTSGTGLYYYDGYTTDYESAELFDEEIGYVTGKYLSYSEALEKELGVYGFSYTPNQSIGKFTVTPSNSCKKIQSYSTF